MPELPEVETIVRTNRDRLVGRRIVAFSSSWPRGVLPTVARVRRAIVGRTISDVTRRAKYIVFHLSGDEYLLVHLRMSGRFEWADGRRRRPPHVRATWTLDDGQRLLFCDARKFGRIVHATNLAGATAHLGLEPLERCFDRAALASLLRDRRRQLKPLLLDQALIAGLGNIYTDESLHRAGLHPRQRSDGLTPAQVERLHAAIRTVLRLAIRNHGTSIDWIYPGGWMQRRLRVYGRAGEPCRRCGTTIVALRVGQRGTYICPQCQPLNGA